MTQKKLIGCLVSLGFLLGACQWIPLEEGQEAVHNCPAGQEATVVVDENSDNAFVRCNGDVENQTIYPCPTTVSAGPVAEGQVRIICRHGEAVLDGQAEPDTAAYQALLAADAEAGTVTTAAAGDGCWRFNINMVDWMGPRPDEPGDDFNFLVGLKVYWCVKGGLVLGGMSITDYVWEGRIYEIGNGMEYQVSPWNQPVRDIDVDWDMRFGWCPWCIGVDVDAAMHVEKYGHYWGKMRHNGDGI